MSNSIWHEFSYKTYNSFPQTEHYTDTIPCLVKTSDGEIFRADWVDNFDYHREPFTGWKFLSFTGEYYCSDENDDKKVIAFAYLRDVV